MACCCDFTDTVDQQFTSKKAGQELAHYRRKGAGPTTRLLIDGISQAGVTDGTLLDIGAGIGALTFELLERGFDRAVIVEASAGYTATASSEAVRRSRATDINFVSGDFLEVAGTVPMASVVALDRVVCCYPLYEELLNEAVRHAERGFAFSYPRDRWYVRVGMSLENALRRRKSGFRTFVHSETRMRELITLAGFDLVSQRRTLIWSADVFIRRAGQCPPELPNCPHDCACDAQKWRL
jgi:tRNA1(Val) A37 N6-methylase TrmN6